MPKLQPNEQLIVDAWKKEVDAAEWGTWGDPGDYPNGIASGPLPSETYLEWHSEGDDFEVTIPWSEVPDDARFCSECPLEDFEHDFTGKGFDVTLGVNELYFDKEGIILHSHVVSLTHHEEEP